MNEEFYRKILTDLESDLIENERDIERTLDNLNDLKVERIRIMDAIMEIKTILSEGERGENIH